MILNCEPLEEVDCFKYLGLQLAADGGCERDVVHSMNEGYGAWGALKSVLSNRGLGIKDRKCLYEGVIVATALRGAEAMGMRSAEIRKVNVLKMKCYSIYLTSAPLFSVVALFLQFIPTASLPSPSDNHYSTRELSEKTQGQAKMAA